MKFKDRSLEKGFIKNHQQYVQEIGILYILEMAVTALIYLGFALYDLLSSQHGPQPRRLKDFLANLALAIVFILAPIIHFLLSKKFFLASSYFANVQILLYQVLLLESGIIGKQE